MLTDIRQFYSSNKLTLLIPGFVMLCAVWLSCGTPPKKYSNSIYGGEVPDSNIERGALLARQYCQSCHALPDPALADARTWHLGILPAMGPRLGIFRFGYKDYPTGRNEALFPKDYYPAKPLLSNGDWQDILDYYVSQAPDSLAPQKRDRPIAVGKAPFTATWPDYHAPVPATSFIRWDTLASPQSIVVADAIKKTLIRYTSALRPVDSLISAGSIVDMQHSGNDWLACNIGVLNPNNGKFGSVFRVLTNGKKGWQREMNRTDSLQRPVQMIPVDLDKDGQTDYLICEFGNKTGALSWYRNTGNNQFQRRLLRAVPGAIHAVINDYNHDGLPDIWCLFAQGDEGIFLFTNKGNGRFEQEEVLRFPAINGSSYFELDDFNKDGYPDILYTCGDNADYSAILKPYHGVYIFTNDGRNHFTQQFFYPLNGCYKAMARDFDGDGNLDIATISFFADYQHQPEEGFVYFENRGALSFQPSSVTETQKGRWLTMDVGDVNGDGRPDVLLGNFSIAPSFIKAHDDWQQGPRK